MPRKTKAVAACAAATDKTAQPQFSAAALEQTVPGPLTSAKLESIFQRNYSGLLNQ
jgi:hypothetical protein